MTTTITASSTNVLDDGSYSSSLSFFSTNGLTASANIMFVRIPSVALPSGSTITSATLTLHGSTASGTSLSEVVTGCAEDNPTAPANAADANGRPRTTASYSSTWTITGAVDQTVDVTSIVSELVARPGWVSGNAILLFADGAGSGSASETFHQGGEGALAPTLTVTYTTGGGSPYFHHGGSLTGSAWGAFTGSFVPTATQVGADVVLTWPAMAGTGYQVERDGVITATTPGTTWTDAAPSAGNHTYRVGVLQ